MDKETLLNNILKDLGEVETMVKTFQGQATIPTPFLNLTEDKLNALVKDFSLLKDLNSGNVSQSIHVQTPKHQEEPITPVQAPPAINEEVSTPVENTKEEPTVTEEPPVEDPVAEEIIPEIKKEIIEEVVTETEIQIETRKTIISEPTVEINKEDNSKTLGESFAGEKKSVNDIIATNQVSDAKKVLKGKPVTDLTKGLGINDRFMFQRELFNGKSEVMSQTLQQLNDLPDFTSAQSFIKSNFNWDDEQEVTQAFFNYIERRF
ncbi:hypothetical protein [Labilibacter marinus]|uniref:hypothetical protein n=1 Tax=Labilibacter marinus TaxID=1477105 RepID=UPI000830777B|nr:hypothetical protein [Labilibacter marinus]